MLAFDVMFKQNKEIHEHKNFHVSDCILYIYFTIINNPVISLKNFNFTLTGGALIKYSKCKT